MVEAVIIFYVGRDNWRLARSKGRSRVGRFMATAVTWLVLELGVGFGAATILSQLGVVANEEPWLRLSFVYVPALVAAGVGVMGLNSQLHSLPSVVRSGT